MAKGEEEGSQAKKYTVYKWKPQPPFFPGPLPLHPPPPPPHGPGFVCT